MASISENSNVRLGLVMSAVSIIIAGTAWATTLYARVDSLEEKGARIESANREVVMQLKELNDTMIEIKVLLKKGDTNGKSIRN